MGYTLKKVFDVFYIIIKIYIQYRKKILMKNHAVSLNVRCTKQTLLPV